MVAGAMGDAAECDRVGGGCLIHSVVIAGDGQLDFGIIEVLVVPFMTSTPFSEAHWSRESFIYKGFPAYWDEDHPEQEFWLQPELAESKYSELIQNDTIRKWDSLDESGLNLSELTSEEKSILEWKRKHYFVDLELLCYEAEGGDVQVASYEEVLEWAGIDPKDLVEKIN